MTFDQFDQLDQLQQALICMVAATEQTCGVVGPSIKVNKRCNKTGNAALLGVACDGDALIICMATTFFDNEVGRLKNNGVTMSAAAALCYGGRVMCELGWE